MKIWRALLIRHRALAALLLLGALLLKAAVPAGFMLSSAQGYMTVSICSDPAGPRQEMRIAIPRSEDHRGDTTSADKQTHCAFSSLTKAATSGVHLTLLALAIAFVMLLGTRAMPAITLARPPFIRPPLRAPPRVA